MKNGLFKKFLTDHAAGWEFLRYALFSFLTKLINIAGEAVVRFCFEPQKYEGFFSVLLGRTDVVYITVVATAVGFTLASVAEYFLSVAFVFEKNGKGNTPLGFLGFMGLSAGGLGISVLMKYLGETLLGFPWLAVNIVGGFAVLAYNYAVKKLLLFRRKKDEKEGEGEKNEP